MPTPLPVVRHDDPDVQLMLRVRDDDAAAFAELQKRYGPRIFGHFVRSLGDRQEAEDLAQEVFLRLYRSRKRYEPRARFATWLFHITQNVSRNAYRSRKRRSCVHLDAGKSASADADLSVIPDRSESPSRPAERTETAVLVRAAVANLTDRQRDAIVLHQFEGHSYNEVAQRLALGPEAAKSLLYRARGHLRVALADYVGEGG